jgi:hypothetical protein
MLIGKMWKEADVAYFKVLCQYSPGETEENHRKSRSE